MPCYHPLSGWRARRKNPNGKRSIVFTKSQGFGDMAVSIPCGVCIGCRLEHSRQWAIRCMHEAQMHENNCFVTLTYSEDKLPPNGTLVKRDFQLFMKKLRKKYGKNIRFYMAGEYGPKLSRPHYHACLFGVDFSDKTLWKVERGNNIYISDDLASLWGNGFVTIGEVTFETAAYTARYCTKKIRGKDAKAHYEKINSETGEVIDLQPEFALMSRRPGIGRPWLEKYETDVFPSDFVIVNAHEVKPPKYYTNQLEKADPVAHAKLKNKRKKAGLIHEAHNTLSRLFTREKVKTSRANLLKRSYENDDETIHSMGRKS